MAEYIKKENVLDEAYWHGDRYTVQNPYPSGVEAVDVGDIEEIETIDIVKCGECKYFELNPVTIVDNVPLILVHEICHFWGDGCKTSQNGFCSYGKRKEKHETD